MIVIWSQITHRSGNRQTNFIPYCKCLILIVSSWDHTLISSQPWKKIKFFTCLVYCPYLWDSEDTTTTRAGAERRSTSCRHWTSRKCPRWQTWKVDSRPSSVRLQGWVHTPALHTRMCRGLWRRGRRQKIKHVWLFIDYKWNKEDRAA